MSMVSRLIENAQPHWHAYTGHDFVQQLARGTLAAESFRHYLKQDYLYLFQYCRALSLGIYKAQTFEQVESVQRAIATLLHETRLHVGYCAQWGISEDELRNLPESAACVAYTRYVLDCGISGGLPELYAAIAPCAIGYAQIGKTIAESGISPPNNPYQAWIDAYAAADFQAAAAETAAVLEDLCRPLTAAQLAHVQHIFTTATRMEAAFWQMGLDLS